MTERRLDKLPNPRIADASYSADVEIGPDNKLYYARDLPKGVTIEIPMHMISKAHR
jgi:hypothetical protein